MSAVDYIDKDKFEPTGDFLSDDDIIEYQEEQEAVQGEKEDSITFNVKVGSKIALDFLDKVFLYFENISKTNNEEDIDLLFKIKQRIFEIKENNSTELVKFFFQIIANFCFLC